MQLKYCPKIIVFCPLIKYNNIGCGRMKKMNVINLIKYYTNKNDLAFRKESEEIAKDFMNSGDSELAEYIMALLTNENVWIPQLYENELAYLKKETINNEPLPLPEAIMNDISSIINAICKNVFVNKFLFYGKPGTGKTEAVKQIARILGRSLYSVDFSALIDSKLGQTQKNIVALFNEINSCKSLDKIIILLDELDALVLDRTNSNDLREMGRVTSTFLKELDNLNPKAILFATTNLYNNLDKAIIRRFDAKISFDRYKLEDLEDVGEQIVLYYAKKFPYIDKNSRLLKKIIHHMNSILSPAELKNEIKTSIAFSDPDDGQDYFKRLYKKICYENIDLKLLQEQGFTIREIEVLTGVSKSKVARELKGGKE